MADQDLLARLFDDLVVTMQSAWIEWQHGDGAEAAMEWIENTLAGPGLLPEGEFSTEAQSWHDKHRSAATTPCPCGRPSNITTTAGSFCCEEHIVPSIAKN